MMFTRNDPFECLLVASSSNETIKQYLNDAGAKVCDELSYDNLVREDQCDPELDKVVSFYGGRFLGLAERVDRYLHAKPASYKFVVVAPPDHVDDHREISQCCQSLRAIPLKHSILIVLLTSNRVAEISSDELFGHYDCIVFLPTQGIDQLALQSMISAYFRGVVAYQDAKSWQDETRLRDLFFLAILLPLLAGFFSGVGRGLTEWD